MAGLFRDTHLGCGRGLTGGRVRNRRARNLKTAEVSEKAGMKKAEAGDDSKSRTGRPRQ